MSRATHSLISGLVMLLITGGSASAQSWADKMFEVRKHDFGGVAAGAETVYRFPVKNLYKEDVHLSSVRASCGCTTPTIETEWLKSGEVGYVVARFNTGTFRGQRGANLTVVIDKPRYAEVQLRVDGYIRRDVVLTPGQVVFGQPYHGDGAEQLIQLAYAGRDDWRLTGIDSSNPFVKAELRETQRGGGRVSYDIVVNLSPDAPPGFHRDALRLQTNDRRLAQLPLVWSADIRAHVQVSPQLVLLGDMKAGEARAQRLILKSEKTPFIPQSIESSSFDVAFERPAEAKLIHFVDITLTPKPIEGEVNCKLVVKTDLPGEPEAFAEVHCTMVGR